MMFYKKIMTIKLYNRFFKIRKKNLIIVKKKKNKAGLADISSYSELTTKKFSKKNKNQKNCKL